MKKILLSLFLVLCLTLSVFAVACDSKDNDEEKDNNKKQEQTSDNVEANIAKLVATINEGVDFEALMNEVNSNNEVNAELDKALDQLKTFACQATTAVNMGSEGSAEVYVGMKDGVIYANANDDVAYSFIEDDFKIVSVSQNYEGIWEGYVDDGFAEYIETIKNPVDLEADGSEESQMVMDFLKEIKLPKIEKANVKYENGKYVFDNAYLEAVAYSALDQFVEFAKKLSEGEFDEAEFEAEYEQIKATIDEYLDKFEYSLYCYMKNEALTGIGASFKASAELADEMGCKKFELAFDLSKELIGFTADIVETDDTVIIKGSASIANTFNGDKLVKSAIKVDITAPNDSYEDEYDEATEIYTDIRLEGTATVKVDFVVDYSKFENGEFMKLNGSFTTKYDKAYVWVDEEDYGGYEESAEYTSKYCGKAETLNFNANATAKDGKTYAVDASLKGTSNGVYGEVTVDFDATVDGNNIDGTLEATMNADGDSETVSVTVGANLEAAPDFVEAPADVLQARQDALNEYAQYN